MVDLTWNCPAGKVKKEVKKLVKAGVIEHIPPNKAAAWISPAQFIAKDTKEEKLRLVCDLCQLNKNVKPDCSVFPTPSEIMMSVNPASKYFVKLDLLQGYHQIPLTDKSKNLFVFALEDGLYRYTRAPMGYTGSSHYFNKVIQKLMEGIGGVHIEIDDLLIEAEEMLEALDILRQVLTRARMKNIKLARHKIEFGTQIEFAGVHLGGPDGYRPTTAKIEGIINTPAPTNLTELRSFLGCWNQLRHYIPDYNHSVSQMQTLLKKDTPYVWDKLMQAEFEGIKQLLRSPMGLQPFNKDYKTILFTDYSAKGIGFALTQEHPEDKTKKQLIFCGSSSLSEKQKHLPAIYGENLGIVVPLESVVIG